MHWSELNRLVALLMLELVLAVHADCAAAPKRANIQHQTQAGMQEHH